MHYVILIAIHSLLLFAVILIFWHWHKESTAFRWLAVLLLLSFVCDAASIANHILRLNFEPNLPSNLHTMLNPFLVGLFFFYLLRGRYLLFFITLFLMANFIFSISLSLATPAYGSYNTLTESFLILTLCIIWYFRILKDPPALNIQQLPEFWVVTGFFLSTSGKLIVYTVSTYLLNVLHDNLIVLQTIHNVLSVLGNVFIAYGLVVQQRGFRRLGNPHPSI